MIKKKDVSPENPDESPVTPKKPSKPKTPKKKPSEPKVSKVPKNPLGEAIGVKPLTQSEIENTAVMLRNMLAKLETGSNPETPLFITIYEDVFGDKKEQKKGRKLGKKQALERILCPFEIVHQLFLDQMEKSGLGGT